MNTKFQAFLELLAVITLMTLSLIIIPKLLTLAIITLALANQLSKMIVIYCQKRFPGLCIKDRLEEKLLNLN